MADSTSIPIIVQGNSFNLAIPLQIYVIDDGTMVLQDYDPDPTDTVTIQLKGSRRNYTYTPTISDNVATIALSGDELADIYGVVVTIVKADTTRLRSFRTDQFFIVESSDDLTPDDIIEGLEDNVIYLNSQCFVAGEAGRGITSISKTGTAGLVDTYTITYTDGTTSTYTITNGQNGTNGTNGAQGPAGVGISSIAKTGTAGLVDTYTITLTNGTTTTFTVTNGADGQDGTNGTNGRDGVDGVISQVSVSGATPTQEIQANTFYKFTGNITSLTITLGMPTFGVANVYAFSFTAGQDNPTITLPAGVEFNEEPTINNGDFCEVSILNDKALMQIWQATP